MGTFVRAVPKEREDHSAIGFQLCFGVNVDLYSNHLNAPLSRFMGRRWTTWLYFLLLNKIGYGRQSLCSSGREVPADTHARPMTSQSLLSIMTSRYVF